MTVSATFRICAAPAVMTVSSLAPRMTEIASLPLTGYVWEQDGRIVGNASLIPFRDNGKRIFLIANVATHPITVGAGSGVRLPNV